MPNDDIEKPVAALIIAFLVAESDARARRTHEIDPDGKLLKADGDRLARIESRQLRREWETIIWAIRTLTDRDRRGYGVVAETLARLRAGIDPPDTIVWAVRSPVTHRGVLASRLEYWERRMREAGTP